MKFLVAVLMLAAVANAFTLSQMKDKMFHLTNSLVLGEQLIMAKDSHECVEKLLCTMETMGEEELKDDAFKPVENFIALATNDKHQMDEVMFSKVKVLLKSYPKFSHLLDSLSFGKKFNNSAMCATAYDTCPLNKENLMNVVKYFGRIANTGSINPFVNDDNSDDQSTQRVRRSCPGQNIGCGTAGALCGVSAVGCGVCEFLSAGLCTPACATGVAGACGAVGAGCGVAQAACNK